MSTATTQQKSSHGSSAFWLTVLIFVGLVAGGVAGEFLHQRYGPPANADQSTSVAGSTATLDWYVDNLDFVGNTFFMNLLRMVLVPLVVSSVIGGVASIGDPSRLGRIGFATLVYYFATMVAAVLLGLFLVTLIEPGAGFDESFRDARVAEFQAEESTARDRVAGAAGSGLVGAFRNIATQMIPTNPVQAAAEGQLLPLISFSILLGVAITVAGPGGRPLAQLFDSLLTVIMKLVDWILWLAPLGVFALMAASVAKIGMGALVGPLSKYVATVLTGLGIHGFVVLPLVLYLFTRRNPYRYLHQMRAALMTALGTDSSSATLPVTIESAETQGQCSRRAARFVLPLGATINMDGTALYEAVAVVFLFQSFGIPLGGTELAIIVITATLAAVGAAGIPSAGLFTMVIVVEAVNASLGGDKQLPISAVGIILGIDRLLDMCRTVVNVWGDAVGAKIISRIAPDDPDPASVPI